MAEAIRAGADLHRLVAAQVTGKPPDAVTRSERSKAKPINFGKPGAMGDPALKDYARAVYGIALTDAEVAALSDAWFGLFLPAVYLGGVLMALPAGWLTDRLGVRLTLVLGQLLLGEGGVDVVQVSFWHAER